MSCTTNGHTLQIGERMLVAEVKGEQFVVRTLAPQCSTCGRVLLDHKGRRSYRRASADAYRQKYGLLSSQEIDQLRRNLRMTWREFADFVQIGPATLKRWMGGEVQTPSLDLLVRYKADLRFAQQAATELAAMLAETSAVYVNTVEVTPQAELAALRADLQRMTEERDLLNQLYEAAEANVARLEAALRAQTAQIKRLMEYAIHMDNCPAWPQFTSHFSQAVKIGECNCGLSTLLTSTTEEKK